MRIKTIMEFPGKIPRPFLTLFGFLLVLVIGSIDTLTNYEISVLVLYLLPIILIAWYEGGVAAALISIFSAVTWAVSDLASGHIYSHKAVPIWNFLMVLVMFLLVAYSMVTLKKLTAKEREHARIDERSGVSNIVFFYEQARIEIVSGALHKRPLTLAYINIDHLRHVNDTFGHMAGDNLIHEVPLIMKSTLRPTDIISRPGGAQFAILMPDTRNENAAAIIYNIQEHLLEMVTKNGWPVTFSTGVVTCEGPPCTIDELINTAEDLMNAARETGPNAVMFKILDLPSTAS